MHLVRCLLLLALDFRPAKGGIAGREEKLVVELCRCNISISLVLREGWQTEDAKMLLMNAVECTQHSLDIA
jgi:hypothetical protein